MKSYFLPILGLTLITNAAFGSASANILNYCDTDYIYLASTNCIDSTLPKKAITDRVTSFSNLREGCTYKMRNLGFYSFGEFQTGQAGSVAQVTLGNAPCQCTSGC